MNGFGFIEYKDAMDARDVVPGTCSPPPIYLNSPHRHLPCICYIIMLNLLTQPVAFRTYTSVGAAAALLQ
jgi:hypothetical protein